MGRDQRRSRGTGETNPGWRTTAAGWMLRPRLSDVEAKAIGCPGRRPRRTWRRMPAHLFLSERPSLLRAEGPRETAHGVGSTGRRTGTPFKRSRSRKTRETWREGASHGRGVLDPLPGRPLAGLILQLTHRRASSDRQHGGVSGPGACVADRVRTAPQASAAHARSSPPRSGGPRPLPRRNHILGVHIDGDGPS